MRLILFLGSQGEDMFSRKVYEQQKINKWPGSAEETAKICEVLGIENVNYTDQNPNTYLKIVSEALHKKNEARLRSCATGKCERILGEIYEKR